MSQTIDKKLALAPTHRKMKSFKLDHHAINEGCTTVSIHDRVKTKHADRRMIFKLYPLCLQRIMICLY